jgi:uncharacterized membrane protein
LKGDSTLGQRVRSIDWMRGVSVLLMIVAHCLIFLDSTHNDDAVRGYFNEINGLPAPAFLLAAGFSLAFVFSRDESDVARRSARLRKSLGRIGQVLVASLLLRHVMWDAFRNPHTLLWVDILTCIALMLLTTWGALAFVRGPARAVVLAVLAAAAFVAAPFVEAPQTFGPVTGLINNALHVNTWPLVPWAAYGWVGAVIGLAAGRAQSTVGAMCMSFGALVVVGLMMSLSGPLVRLVDAEANPYMLTNAGTRLWKLGVVGVLMLAFERGGEKPWPNVGRLIDLLSRQSLVAYVGHLILIFGYWKFQPLNLFIGNVGWAGYLALTLMVLAGTTGLCLLVERMQWRLRFKRDYAQNLTPARPS